MSGGKATNVFLVTPLLATAPVAAASTAAHAIAITAQWRPDPNEVS